ncbi:hypothetical protein BCR44DRAFT_1425581 [Catenaria anguillulae PL171]|uniref:Uncharacterized protein n=1 Tax=Catenaria anguillulae PL171 TaxID=765915 RepID=A0A1Y2I0L4_9FUNG|nr:hypothetical protein BCR44DRAFT_1425581 [Catenaria anguillulae PL171]
MSVRSRGQVKCVAMRVRTRPNLLSLLSVACPLGPISRHTPAHAHRDQPRRQPNHLLMSGYHSLGYFILTLLAQPRVGILPRIRFHGIMIARNPQHARQRLLLLGARRSQRTRDAVKHDGLPCIANRVVGRNVVVAAGQVALERVHEVELVAGHGN